METAELVKRKSSEGVLD